MGRRWLFAFFVVSGFCSLVLEVVWLRLAMASFGVTTALVSIVLSTFMGGLALGSWGAGRLSRRLETKPPALALRAYALAELVIAVGASLVPVLLTRGRALLMGASGEGWGSAAYHAWAGFFVALALLPFCACMGATFPLALSVLRGVETRGTGRSFSYLYVANVVGATAGTLLSAFVLIELLGFRGTLALVAFLNATLCAAALALSLSTRLALRSEGSSAAPAGPVAGHRGVFAALFLTGLVSMGMEVAWVRQLTPYLGNVVYTFALILAAYLAATFLGSAAYRARWRRPEGAGPICLPPAVWAVLAVLALLPLVAADPLLPFPRTVAGGVARVLLATVPFCAVLGGVTPFLVDRWSGGDPLAVGSAYAVNVVGCILGPLVAGFGLLPLVGERGTLAALVLLLLGLGVLPLPRADRPRGLRWVSGAVVVAAALLALTHGFESSLPGARVRRDATATVAAYGEGMDKQILVNGIGMTLLTPITKMMVHLPLAFQAERARSVLVICFGMGTSYRSSLSWGIRTTAIELVPSVPSFFGFFHPDAPELLRSPLGRVVVDDGRRYLERSPDQYDVIVIDPPPPIQAAGSSLLYSREFYTALRRRLPPPGIVQQWIPGGDSVAVAAFIRALTDSFPHVRGYRSMEGWGVHLLASAQPLPAVTAETLSARMPPAAVQDLLAWGPHASATAQFDAVLSREVPLQALTLRGVGPLSDDKPVNEYFVLRRYLAGGTTRSAPLDERTAH